MVRTCAKILIKRGKSARKLLLHAVDIDKVPDGLCVKVNLYSPVRRKRRTSYKYGSVGTVGIEIDAYPVTSILYIVQFNYNSSRDEYRILFHQMNGKKYRIG